MILDNLNLPIRFGLKSSECSGGAFLISVNSFFDIPSKSTIANGEIKQIDNVVQLSSNYSLISKTKLGVDVLVLGNHKNQSLTTVSVVQPKVLIPDLYEPKTYLHSNHHQERICNKNATKL